VNAPSGSSAIVDTAELVCPLTGQALHPIPIEAAEAELCRGEQLAPRSIQAPRPVGRTAIVLVRDDGACAYPVVDGIPILLGPERLTPPKEPFEVDLGAPQYAEAYSQMDFYNTVAFDLATTVASSSFAKSFGHLIPMPSTHRTAFPEPRGLWIDSTYEPGSQWDAYLHLAPLMGKRVLQLGGSGLHAVKFLLAGAERATLVSPMIGELQHARALATLAQVGDRLRTVAGVAEELPLADATMEAVHASSCIHHTETAMAGMEVARVLTPGGRFSALEPWRGPLYDLGIRIFGKREPIACKPMTAKRSEALATAFDRFEVCHHGALTRYPLIALWKLGLELTPMTVWRINRLDDAISSLLPRLRAKGSGVALLGWRD
jgi:SAM-dependent methyltransferase